MEPSKGKNLEFILKIGYMDLGAKLEDGRIIYGKTNLRMFYDPKNDIIDGPYETKYNLATKEITYNRLAHHK
jgi:hypothetical protein